jgi:hypothetical protein
LKTTVKIEAAILRAEEIRALHISVDGGIKFEM